MSKNTSIGHSSRLKGKNSEEIALKYFLNLSYQLIAKNFKISGVEIDLILFKHHYYLIEIKSLRSLSEIHFRLHRRQKERLMRARNIFEEKTNQLVELKVFYVLDQGEYLLIDIADH